ncbi:MAG: sortase [Actinomycetota bacterium]
MTVILPREFSSLKVWPLISRLAPLGLVGLPIVPSELDKMRPDDEITIRGPVGERYVYRVYDRLTVRPVDYWAAYPVEGKTIVFLQTCALIPTFENRLIVRAELVG